MRRAARKHRIQQDNLDKNGSLVYRDLRDKEQKVISGLACPIFIEAKLIRLSKGMVRLLLTTDCKFREGDALYGDIPIKILSQSQRLICIEPPCVTIPLRGTLSQSRHTEDIDTLSRHFFSFWNPMWQRDTETEATDLSAWDDVFHDILPSVPPRDPIPITCSDPHVIRSTIQRLKSYKAPGVDGWRAQELKLLPLKISRVCFVIYGPINSPRIKC